MKRIMLVILLLLLTITACDAIPSSAYGNEAEEEADFEKEWAAASQRVKDLTYVMTVWFFIALLTFPWWIKGLIHIVFDVAGSVIKETYSENERRAMGSIIAYYNGDVPPPQPGGWDAYYWMVEGENYAFSYKELQDFQRSQQ